MALSSTHRSSCGNMYPDEEHARRVLTYISMFDMYTLRAYNCKRGGRPWDLTAPTSNALLRTYFMECSPCARLTPVYDGIRVGAFAKGAHHLKRRGFLAYTHCGSCPTRAEVTLHMQSIAPHWSHDQTLQHYHLMLAGAHCRNVPPNYGVTQPMHICG